MKLIGGGNDDGGYEYQSNDGCHVSYWTEHFGAASATSGAEWWADGLPFCDYAERGFKPDGAGAVVVCRKIGDGEMGQSAD